MSESQDGSDAFFQEGVALMADAIRGPARRVPVYAQMALGVGAGFLARWRLAVL